MAGRYPDRFLEELRRSADLVQYVSSYVALKQNGRRYWGLCPFHGEKTASFSVDPSQQLYYCFGCKKGGTVFTFIQEMEHLTFPEAIAFVADREHIPLPEMEEDPAFLKRKQLRARIYEANREAARFYHSTLFTPAGSASLAYLRSRGLNDSTIRKFGLGAAPDGYENLKKHLVGLGFTEQELLQAGLLVSKESDSGTRHVYDMFRNRCMFPIIDQYGNVTGFGGRILGTGPIKYLNTADTVAYNKRFGVYAANLLRKERNLDRIILVEGYMDVIALTQFGVRGVVASLGTAFTHEQARLLKRYAPKIYLSYDGDSAGQHAILRALDILRDEEIPARVLDYPDGMDPDEFIRRKGPEAFEKLPVLSPESYRLRRLRDEHDLSTQEGKTEYAKAAGRILKDLDPVDLENQLKELMIQTGFSREVLLAQIDRSAPLPRSSASGTPRPPEARTIMRSHEKTDEDVHTQETILSILASLDIPHQDIVGPEDFTDPFLRDLFLGLDSGKSVALLVDMQSDEPSRERASQVLLSPASSDRNEDILMLKESIHHLRILRLNRQRDELRKALSAADDDNEKQRIMSQIQEISGMIRKL